MFGRLALPLLAILALFAAGSARAERVTIGRTACYAVTPATIADARLAQLRFTCTGKPTAYQAGSLWIRVDPGAIVRLGDGVALLVGQTRFDRLRIFFAFADGTIATQQVRRGDYGDHWRIGAQIVFVAPRGGAPLDHIVLRFDHVASAGLVRVRLMPVSPAGRDIAVAAALIGGALVLLLLGAAYNISLAAAARRQFLVWHAIWAVTMFAWGMVWSQFALLFAPGLAGASAARLATALACAAVFLASLCGVTALDRAAMPRWLRRVTLGLASAMIVLGIPASLGGGPMLEVIGPLLSFTLVADLVAIALCTGIAWRNGNAEARDMAFAWAVPMLTLGLTEYIDLGDRLFGGGSQIAVLFACAFQTVWLALATTVRLARLRIERDIARAAESEIRELANRDSLTGLLNRRGFIERTRILFGAADQAEMEFALLLIDIDHFKLINDGFGHEMGDEVLCRIAARLRRWERELCVAGRLGGEEFVLGVSGLSAYALSQFADQLRIDLGACDHGAVTAHRRVTVSIGVAAGHAASTFEKLYGMADRALYEAKHAGRDRVSFHGLNEDWLGALTRDQLSFELGPQRG